MVVSAVAEVTVTQMLGDPGASIEYLDGDDATLTDADTGVDGHQVTLAEGDNVIKVKVTAADGNTTQTYVVTVDRADTTAPTLTRARVTTTGNSIHLFFSEDLDLTDGQTLSATVQGAFSLTVDGVEQEIPRIDRGSGAAGANRLIVYPSSTITIYGGHSVVVSYDQSAAGTDAIADPAGNEVADFTTGSGGVPAVTNDSTATCTLNTGDLWCGVVTVAEIGSGEYGFVLLSGTKVGDLTDNSGDRTFRIGTASHRVYRVAVSPFGLSFAVTRTTVDNVQSSGLHDDDRARLHLHVDGHSASFAFSDAAISGSLGYEWSGASLDWSSTGSVTLRLREVAALSSDATLSGLTVTGDGSDLVTFVSGTTDYTASVANTVAEVTVTPTTNDTDATIAYLDTSDMTLTDADTAKDEFQVTLAEGDTVIKVKVTAADGNTTETYTVTVNRAAPTCTLNAGDIWCGVVTVESIRWGTGTMFVGYGFDSGGGDLSDKDFSYGTNSYTIDHVRLTGSGSSLSFSLTTALADADRARLVLHIGNTPLAFSVALYAVDPRTYSWTTTSLALNWSGASRFRVETVKRHWSSADYVTLRLREAPNNAPVFSGTAPTREVPENSAADTDVGDAVTAMDDDGDTLEYTLEGTDASSFDIVSTSGQIQTKSRVTYNYEATKNSYSVAVKASDGTASATIDVTINLTDEDEQPDTPAKPRLAAVSGSDTSLAARWTKPGRNGGPDISGYNVEYREGTSGDWETFTHGGTGVTRTITGLTASTSYQVRVQALNGETPSDWSDPSDEVTPNAEVVPPTVVSVAVKSAPRSGDTYGWGETIVFTLTFSQKVRVTGQPQPTLAFDLGRSTREARYTGITDTDVDSDPRPRPRPEGVKVHFAYTVQPGDRDTDGIQVGELASAIDLGGARIQRAADLVDADGHKVDGLDADLAYAALGRLSDHKVDGGTAQPPAGSGITIIDTYGNPLKNNRLTLREGTRGRYGLKLNTRPTHTVRVVMIASDGDPDLQVLPTANADKAITPDEWETPFYLDLRAAIDDDDEENGERFFLNHSSSQDPAYHDLILPDVTVVENDRDNDEETLPGRVAEPPTAAFEGLPARHDGETAFTFRIAFSEAVSVTPEAMRTRVLTVAGGAVTGAARVAGESGVWAITVTPDSREELSITLAPATDCAADGAVCTSDGRALSGGLAHIVSGPGPDEPESNRAATGAPTISGTPQVGEALTASTSGISDADGLDDARFAYQWIRTGADIQGATGSTYTPVAADEGKRLKVRVSFTDDAGNEERLTSAATDAVAAAPEPLTASFEGMPAEHRGQGSFSFRVAFSEGISISYKTVRDASFRVTGGDVTRARRVDKRRDLWKITIEPNSDGAVTVRLPETTDCGASGAICTGDGRPLSHSLSATVAGPVGISVADARVDEGEEAVLAFLVTLSRAASAALTVDYATADGSAHAGDDYRAASGTLTFGAGERSTTIEVGVLDDSHDEGEETLTLTLSNPSSGRVTDAEATGTIVNRDPLPRALLARFGRTAAVHVVEQVEERLEARRAPGFEGRFAGRALRPGMERELAESFLRRLGGQAGAGSAGAGDPMADIHDPLERRNGLSGAAGTSTRVGDALGGGGGLEGALGGEGLLRLGLGGGDVLTGSGFALNRATRHGGTVSLWSRGAQSRFSGREGALSLGGAVRTTMFGADYVKGRLTAGLSLSHSGGVGEYAGHGLGEVVSSVTGLYPWLGYQATDRLSVWGVAGYGSGTLSLTPEGGTALASDLGMALGALGARGELFGAAGYGLAFKADALWVGTSIEGVDGPSGRLAATEAAVTRLRTALEGSRDFRFGSGLSLKPSVEVGVRRDGGDAETGAGLDMGGGVVVSAPSVGLSADVKVRMLLAHEAEEFRERGVSVSLSYDPTPATPFGLRARLAPSWGGQATSGAEALWGRETLSGMAPGGFGAAGSRLNADIGYGMPVGRHFVGTPRLAVMTSGMGRDYRVGYGLGVLEPGSLRFELGIDAQRRESPLAGGANHGVAARATLSW